MSSSNPETQLLPYTPGACWVCGAPADAREHRIKRSDLVRNFGPGPYRGGAKLLHVKGKSAPREVQGPSAETLKYASSLCGPCNNSRTQPQDRAYERFADWVREHEDEILATQAIDLQAVFGLGWAAAVDNLLRYFAKSLGCRIHDIGRPVPLALAEAVRGGAVPAALTITFAIQVELAYARDQLGQFISKSDLRGNEDPASSPFYRWEERLGWLTTFFAYRQPPALQGCSVLSATDSALRLEWYTNLSEEGWVEHIESTRRAREAAARDEDPA